MLKIKRFLPKKIPGSSSGLYSVECEHDYPDYGFTTVSNLLWSFIS